VRHIEQQNVSCTIILWGHPDEAVELRVTRGGEGMWSLQVNSLARQNMYSLRVFGCELVMRQMKMEIECGYVFEQPKGIEVTKGSHGYDLSCVFD
jgi:subtilisin-like proprotein convertase family protein